MKLRTLESRNLTLLFHIFLLKLRKYNPANWILSRQNLEIKSQDGNTILPCVCSFDRSQATSKCGSSLCYSLATYSIPTVWMSLWHSRQNRVYLSGNRLSVVKCVQGFFKCDLNQTKMITLVSYNRCSWSARTQELRENAYESTGNRYTFHHGFRLAIVFFFVTNPSGFFH